MSSTRDDETMKIENEDTRMNLFVEDLKKLNDFSKEIGKKYTREEIWKILDEMKSLLLGVGPIDFDMINDTQKQTLGLLIMAAKDCPTILGKVDYTREALGTLRTNVIMCGGPDYKKYLSQIDNWNDHLMRELDKYGVTQGESVASLWSETHKALDMCYLISMKGYSSIKPDVIRFTGRIEQNDHA